MKYYFLLLMSDPISKANNEGKEEMPVANDFFLVTSLALSPNG